jgi:hypothetical protein
MIDSLLRFKLKKPDGFFKLKKPLREGPLGVSNFNYLSNILSHK